VSAWWTPADSAELDCLIYELVRSYFEHRERCEACQSHSPCPALATAITVVAEWRQMRELLSRAEYLRAERLEGAA
jgi:hypothetical protein